MVATVNQPWLILITGPVDAGKTTTAGLLADPLGAAGTPCAAIDLDALRCFAPRPPADPFGTALGYANLAAVAANYRPAGIPLLILADVVETPVQVAAYTTAVPGARVTGVRLRVAPDRLAARLRQRHTDPAERDWYLARGPEAESWVTDGASVGGRQGADDYRRSQGVHIDRKSTEHSPCAGWVCCLEWSKTCPAHATFRKFPWVIRRSQRPERPQPKRAGAPVRRAVGCFARPRMRQRAPARPGASTGRERT